MGKIGMGIFGVALVIGFIYAGVPSDFRILRTFTPTSIPAVPAAGSGAADGAGI